MPEFVKDYQFPDNYNVVKLGAGEDQSTVEIDTGVSMAVILKIGDRVISLAPSGDKEWGMHWSVPCTSFGDCERIDYLKDGEERVVGRDPKPDGSRVPYRLHSEAGTVSRNHATIALYEGLLTITDIASTNGTAVGVPATRMSD